MYCRGRWNGALLVLSVAVVGVPVVGVPVVAAVVVLCKDKMGGQDWVSGVSSGSGACTASPLPPNAARQWGPGWAASVLFRGPILGTSIVVLQYVGSRASFQRG